MDCHAFLQLNDEGRCELCGPCLGSQLTHNQIQFLTGALNQTARHLWDVSFSGYHALLGKTVALSLVQSLDSLIQVTPQEILVDIDLLRFKPSQKESRRHLLVALLERALFQWSHRETHISQVMHHSLHFLAVQDKMCVATINAYPL